ncbi:MULTISPECIES: NAD-dependent epimerase/dehydratase family protein [unclassified Chitinophaga]|uniref:NAD-dependent epimerase/dehydratase family protein n=1 Tax=unclassified Chitinophaga TaxID=2619133 RepID=UPI003010529F
MNIFLTGANGYIGSSVGKLLTDKGHTIYGLVRDKAKATDIRQLGFIPVVGTLEDDELLTRYAALADGVIHAADSEHFMAVQTLLDALAGTGKLFIHTSGSSIVADDVLGDVENPQVFEEITSYTPLEARQAGVTINELVLEAGAGRNIRSVVIVPSMIYGDSLGLDVESVQLPCIYRKSIKTGKGVFIGRGINRWSNVHIADVADLYLMALERAPAGTCLFAENGEESYKDLAVYISNALGFGGATESWNAADALAEVGGLARYGLGSNSRIKAVNARRLGWEPKGISVKDWIASNKYAKKTYNKNA